MQKLFPFSLRWIQGPHQVQSAETTVELTIVSTKTDSHNQQK